MPSGEDELIFSGKYKDFELSVRFDLSKCNELEVSSAFGYVSQKIEPYSYKFSGIDTSKIDSFAKISGKGLAAVSDFLEKNSQASIKAFLLGCVKNPDLLVAAESYLFNRLLTLAGVMYGGFSSNKSSPQKEELSDHFSFIGKYKQWVAIKKLGLESVADYEVSAMLASANHTLINKSFDFAGIKKDDSIVDSICKGKRKSYGNLAAALKELSTKLSGSNNDSYIVCKVFETLGFKPYASPDMLSAAHPDIKPPKVKGRKPKG